MDLATYFDGLLANIEPNAENVKIAKRAHEKLRRILEEDPEIVDAKPDTYLSGSYARDTAINDIKDVDIILMIDLDFRKMSPEKSPDVVVTWLQYILQKHYPKVIKQGRSVGVATDSDFCLDVVPVVPFTHKDGPAWMPDRDVKCWVPSHPKGQIQFSVQRNTDTDGCYKPLVKIMKHWRDTSTSTNSRIKSYILESLVAECVTTKPLSYGRAVSDIFNFIYRKYSTYLVIKSVPVIADPGYPGVNTAKRWTYGEFESFMAAVARAIPIARAALESTDENESVRNWQKLFGSKFSKG